MTCASVCVWLTDPTPSQYQWAARGQVATLFAPEQPTDTEKRPSGVSPMSPDKSVTQVPGCTYLFIIRVDLLLLRNFCDVVVESH